MKLAGFVFNHKSMKFLIKSRNCLLILSAFMYGTFVDHGYCLFGIHSKQKLFYVLTKLFISIQMIFTR